MSTSLPLKSSSNYDTIWRGGIISDNRRGYALVLTDNTDTWDTLRIEDHGDTGWVVVWDGETITPDAVAPWHLRKDGKPSKEAAQWTVENLLGVYDA